MASIASLPQVSVALASYNGCRWLPQQLDSVLRQLAADDEVVVVDDGSTDDTPACVHRVGDARVRLIASPVNVGVRSSFGRALSACRARHVFLCDQDDVWLPGKRDTLLAALQAGATLALSDAEVIDADGHVIEPSFMARRGGFRGGVIHTLVKNRYLGCAMAFRRELLDWVLPIPADVPMHDMWIGALAALHGRVAYIDRPLMKYRRHGGNVSPERRAGMAQMLAWRWRLLRLVASRQLRGPRPFVTELVD